MFYFFKEYFIFINFVILIFQALQEELKNHQGDVRYMTQLAGQLSPSLNVAGASDVNSQQEALAVNWETINAQIADKIQLLTGATKERKAFWERWEQFEQWLHRMQKHVDATSEIYGDEIDNTLSKLRLLQKEVLERQPDYDALSAEVDDLCAHCSDSDRQMLLDQHRQMTGGYQDVKDLLEKRIHMCTNWSQFTELRKGAVSRIKVLQQRLESQELSPEDVDKIHAELAEIQASMGEWNDKQDELEQLMSTSQITVKDRSTQRTLHIQAEIQNLTTSLGQTSTKLEQKKGKLDELAAMWVNFEQQKQGLSDVITQSRDKLQGSSVKQATLDGVKTYSGEIKAVDEQLSGYATQYEELRELGRQLMLADPTRMLQAQSALNSVDSQWESTQALIGEKQGHVTTVTNLWQQFNDARGSVNKALGNCEPVTDGDLVFHDQDQVRLTLDQYKVKYANLLKCKFNKKSLNVNVD